MKNWSQGIAKHIQTWSSNLGNLKWWPTNVYHFTDVNNAVNILKSGFLFCRIEAEKRNLMLVDNASPDVIRQTNEDHLHYARLYFRPRTPTQYRNEGIRPVNIRELGSHCPIPIYFFFDAFSVLSRDDCEFSDGNMGSTRARHSGDENFFTTIPFDLVFHNGFISNEENKEEITFRKNAEVLIPNYLQIDQYLRLIICRSTAEIQTLMNLLPPQQRSLWRNKISLGDALFDRKWTFVEEVATSEEKITFRFNPNSITPGPFQVNFMYQDIYEKNPRIWEGQKESLNKSLSFTIENANEGMVTLKLDDSLAFYGKVIFNEIPF